VGLGFFYHGWNRHDRRRTTSLDCNVWPPGARPGTLRRCSRQHPCLVQGGCLSSFSRTSTVNMLPLIAQRSGAICWWSGQWHTRFLLARFRYGVAAVEFIYPALRGKFTWCHQRASILARGHPIRHAAPAGREVCALLGAKLASSRRARMGLGMMLHNALGLRPSVMLGLTPSDIRLSPEMDQQHVAVFRLGTRRGTKAGRQ